MAVDPSKVNPLFCSEVSQECPLEASIYGYYPSMGWNAFFAANFAVCAFINLGLGLRYRTWSYMVVMVCACITGCIGYVGRVLMHNNPFSDTAFQMQICSLTMSPAFNAAAIYLILKHLVIQFGPELSRIKPKFYTWAFIAADLAALSLQAAGGGIAASSGDDEAFRNIGDRLMITGISWQVLTLLVFALATTDYFVRRFKNPPLPQSAQELLAANKFQIFALALILIYLTVFLRCVYRIVEMAGGWRNPIMQNQPLFIGADSWMIGAATVLQTVVHPGIFFPFLGRRKVNSNEVEKDDTGVDLA